MSAAANSGFVRVDDVALGRRTAAKSWRSFATSSSAVVLLAGVGPVLELDHADLGEALAQPAAGRVEQAELLAVRHDLREQQRLEHLLRGRVHRVHRAVHGLGIDAHPLPHLGVREAALQPLRDVERELLALAHLGVGELAVELLQREHAERDVARLVAHHVAEQLLQQRLGGDLVHHAEGGEREALDHDLHAEVRDVPARVARGCRRGCP